MHFSRMTDEDKKDITDDDILRLVEGVGSQPQQQTKPLETIVSEEQQNPLSAEELESIANQSNISYLNPSGALHSFKNLKADFSYLKPIIGPTEFLELAKKVHVPIIERRAVTFPKKDVYVVADLHGCLEDLQATTKFFTNRLKQGDDAYLLLLGDYIHGLKTKKDGKLVPVYVDNSIEVISQIIELRKLFGGRITPLLGDHELTLILKNIRIKKYGEDLTDIIANQLTEEENKYLKEEVSKFPLAAIIPNGYIAVHGGAAPMIKSLKQLENMKLEEPSDDKYKWQNETPLGRLLMGKHTKDDKNGKEEVIREISYEDNKEFLDTIGGKMLLTGHTGTARFFFVKEGKKRLFESGVQSYMDLGNQTILVTTEGSGCEKIRDEKGNNHYGKIFAIEAAKPFGTLLFSDIGEDTFKKYHFEEEKIQPISKPVEEERYPLTETLTNLVKQCCERKGWPEHMYENFIQNKDWLQKQEESKNPGTVKMIDDTIRFFRTNESRNIPIKLPDDAYLTLVHDGMRKAFLERLK